MCSDIIKLLGHCLVMPLTGFYMLKLYKRPGPDIPCGDKVTAKMNNK